MQGTMQKVYNAFQKVYSLRDKTEGLRAFLEANDFEEKAELLKAVQALEEAGDKLSLKLLDRKKVRRVGRRTPLEK